MADAKQLAADLEWRTQLKRLAIHVFVGVGVFIVLAIPALALDFFNQGIEFVSIQRSASQISSVDKQT